MSDTIMQTAAERAAVDRIKHAAAALFPHLRGTISVSDLFMDAGDLIVAEIRAAVAAERERYAKTLDALHEEAERKGHEIDNLPGVLDGYRWGAEAIRALK